MGNTQSGTAFNGQPVTGTVPVFVNNRVALDGVAKTLFVGDGATVLLSGSTATTLNLPQNPIDGTTLEIVNPSGASYLLNGNGKNIAGVTSVSVSSTITIAYNTDNGWQVVGIGGPGALGTGFLRQSAFLTNKIVALAGDSILSTGQDVSGTLALNGPNFGWVAVQKANGAHVGGPQFQYGGCFGVGGNTTAQVFARYNTIKASGSGIHLYFAGENNNIASPTLQNYIDWFRPIVSYYKQASADGIQFIMGDIVPAGDAIQDSAIALVFYRRLAQFYGIAQYSPYQWSVDANTGTFKAGYSSDNVHPNATGIGVWSDQLYPILNNLAAQGPLGYFCLINPVTTAANALGLSPNLLANGTFYTQSGGKPSSWVVSTPDGNNVLSAPAATLPWTGKTQTLVKTNTAAFTFYQIATGFVPGDTLYFSGGFSCSGLDLTSNTGIEIYLQFRDAGTGNLSKFSPAYVWNANGSFAFVTTCVVPANAADVQVLIYTDGSATYTFNNFTLINQTKFAAIDSNWLV